jgi:hypothetical protein
MKISLRKANALQLAITETISGISFNTDVEITEFEIPQEVIATRHSEFIANIARRDELNDALYDVRKLVSNANHSSGIDGLLNTIARIEKKVQVVSSLAKQRPMIDEKIMLGKLEKIRTQASDQPFYGQESSVKTSIVSQADLDKFKSDTAFFKKQKQALQDTLLELNVRTELELDEKTVTVLKTEQLL